MIEDNSSDLDPDDDSDYMDDCKLTAEQLKAVKKVFRSIREAGELGVKFYDSYGSLTAFNPKKITLPVPDLQDPEHGEFKLIDHRNVIYSEYIPNEIYTAGCADEESLMTFDLVDKIYTKDLEFHKNELSKITYMRLFEDKDFYKRDDTICFKISDEYTQYNKNICVLYPSREGELKSTKVAIERILVARKKLFKKIEYDEELLLTRLERLKVGLRKNLVAQD